MVPATSSLGRVKSGAWTWTSFQGLRPRGASRDLPPLLPMINSPLDPAAGGAGLDCRQVIVCVGLVVRTHSKLAFSTFLNCQRNHQQSTSQQWQSRYWKLWYGVGASDCNLMSAVMVSESDKVVCRVACE